MKWLYFNLHSLLRQVIKHEGFMPFISQEGGENSQPMKEEHLVAVIDDVLRDDDKNNDGYIDYAEFAKSLE